LGRFRISATTDPRPIPAGETPREIEALLLQAAGDRKPEDVERLRQYFLMVAPELAKERAAIEQLGKGGTQGTDHPGHARAAGG
jgi:hypothetical protein